MRNTNQPMLETEATSPKQVTSKLARQQMHVIVDRVLGDNTSLKAETLKETLAATTLETNGDNQVDTAELHEWILDELTYLNVWLQSQLELDLGATPERETGPENLIRGLVRAPQNFPDSACDGLAHYLLHLLVPNAETFPEELEKVAVALIAQYLRSLREQCVQRGLTRSEISSSADCAVNSVGKMTRKFGGALADTLAPEFEAVYIPGTGYLFQRKSQEEEISKQQSAP